ncbi:MAG TPA: alpha/beta hydrolase [Conexibacter sp.]|jgi:pimeloyl-ACP methyl ester carboxylesterase
MPVAELSAGAIEYDDSGPPPGREDAPVVVLLHGLIMDATVWRAFAPGLARDARVIRPTFPLGAHRTPMKPDADLSLLAMTRLIGELLAALDLRDVVLVANDWGGPALIVEAGCAERVGSLVLTSCEAFDDFPPGLPGRFAAAACKLGPVVVKLALAPLRFRPLRRLPMTYGWMSKRPVPGPVGDGWFAPALSDRAIRRDIAKYAGSRIDKAWTTAATERLREFDGPALVIWTPEDRVMKRDHGRRLAELLPQGRLIEIPDSYTLIPEDQPELLLSHLQAFVQQRAAV